MCKYCETQYKKVHCVVKRDKKNRPVYGDRDEAYHEDFGDTCNLTIEGDILRIDYNAYSCDSSFEDKISINYCPHCGRKLKSKE